MIETSIKDLSVEEIMQKLQKEVEKRELPLLVGQIKGDTSDVVTSIIDIIPKRTEEFLIKDIYEYSDFTKYHDVEFVQNIYKGLLKREVDQKGLEYYLNLLRSGEKSKSEIISLIRYSKEGRSKNVSLLGSKKRALQAFLYKIPIIAYVFKNLYVLFTLPKLLKRLNSLENDIAQEAIMRIHNDLLLEKVINIKAQELQLNIDTKAQELQLNIDTKAQELQLNIDTKANIDDIKFYLQSVNYAKEYMKIIQNNMQNLIDEAKKRLPDETFDKQELIALTEEEKHKFDTFYVEFEDKFRGTRKDIKQRVEVYLPYIEELPFSNKEFLALDVGCGRGEWIELLKEHGYNAQGIDLNRIMVAKSQELNLDVEEADVIEYLSSLEDSSLSVITGFHIIEHLPFEVLMKMFEESYRVLKKGGMVIFETPNPENLMVGACNFYGDPTHINPIPPHTASFLVEKTNFNKVKIKRLHEPDNIHFDDLFLNHQFAVGQDYAVIGYKA